jgi:hypothetical protein
VTTAPFRFAFLGLLLICSACSDEDDARTRLQERISTAERHADQALTIFKANRRVQDYVVKAMRKAGDDEAVDWRVTPGVEYASKNEPWYCPDEYVIESTDSSDSDHEKIPWFQVNIRNSRVMLLMSQSEIDDRNTAHNYAEDDNRIDPCLDGKNPVKLDPALLSEGS